MPLLTGGNYDVVVYSIEGSGRSTLSPLVSLWKPDFSGFSPLIGGVGDEITVSGQFFYSGLVDVFINSTGTDGIRAQLNYNSFNNSGSQFGFYTPSNLYSGDLNSIIVNIARSDIEKVK
jgi:hypothetical protein